MIASESTYLTLPAIPNCCKTHNAHLGACRAILTDFVCKIAPGSGPQFGPWAILEQQPHTGQPIPVNGLPYARHAFSHENRGNKIVSENTSFHYEDLTLQSPL